jgi:hypothetical protein
VAESRSVAIAVALVGAAATLGAALIATRPWDDGRDGSVATPTVQTGDDGPTRTTISDRTSVFLSRDSGPGGATVNVSGEGFSPSERVIIRFHTEQIGVTKASDQGRFSNVAVVIPTSFSRFAPQQFDVVALGEESLRAAQAPFTITG